MSIAADRIVLRLILLFKWLKITPAPDVEPG